MQPIRIFIADDNPNFREHVRKLVEDEENLTLAGETPDANNIIKEVTGSRADVVLMDISLPGKNGLDATRILVNAIPHVKVILVSVYDLDEYRDAALANGAYAYLVKKDIMSTLIPLLQKAYAG
jgi:DNA-binding NarL/FixJ family response regulator